jgi:hypothetical protein
VWTRRFLEYAAGKFETHTYYDYYTLKKTRSGKGDA